MARTTAEEVQEIMDTSLTTAQIDPYITVATNIVTEHLVGCGLGDTELEEVERWLTAHLIAITRERQASQEKLGDASITYAGVFGSHLNSTTYGQMAAMLDRCGVLASLGKRRMRIRAITSFE